MKTSLQLKLGQQLTMTPQLQQAIKLLQLSTLDLQQEIQDALDSNPLLEMVEEDHYRSDEHISDKISQENQKQAEEHVERDTSSTDLDLNQQDNIPNELAVDSNWDDIYTHTPTSHGIGDSDDEYSQENRSQSGQSLQEHLLWQLNLSHLSDRDRYIAENILDALNPDGLLGETTAEIVENLNQADIAPDDLFEEDEVIAVLKHVQQLDPPGIGARNLQECLVIQLRQCGDDIDWRECALELLEKYFDLLIQKDFSSLQKKLGLSEDSLKEVIQVIQTLNPRPGNSLEVGESDYVIPDVMVSFDQKNQRWLVELNPDIAPKLRINSSYASMSKQVSSSKDQSFLKDHMQEAKWFIKSLQSRNETLLKVATSIVEHQRGFLEHGPEAMRPLVLAEIAESVGMHESTISRVTSQKFMHTPRGLYELKYFFSSHVGTATGGECSSTAIRAIIKKLIAAENSKKPLSDNKIAQLLNEQGIKVARRTIAKYREAMNIAPSNERKSLV